MFTCCQKTLHYSVQLHTCTYIFDESDIYVFQPIGDSLTEAWVMHNAYEVNSVSSHSKLSGKNTVRGTKCWKIPVVRKQEWAVTLVTEFWVNIPRDITQLISGPVLSMFLWVHSRFYSRPKNWSGEQTSHSASASGKIGNRSPWNASWAQPKNFVAKMRNTGPDVDSVMSRCILTHESYFPLLCCTHMTALRSFTAGTFWQVFDPTSSICLKQQASAPHSGSLCPGSIKKHMFHMKLISA